MLLFFTEILLKNVWAIMTEFVSHDIKQNSGKRSKDDRFTEIS